MHFFALKFAYIKSLLYLCAVKIIIVFQLLLLLDRLYFHWRSLAYNNFLNSKEGVETHFVG